MSRKKQSMDGNQAAAHVAYAFTEVAGIYPITPSSPMADGVDNWSANGQKNVFGEKVKVQKEEPKVEKQVLEQEENKEEPSTFSRRKGKH